MSTSCSKVMVQSSGSNSSVKQSSSSHASHSSNVVRSSTSASSSRMIDADARTNLEAGWGTRSNLINDRYIDDLDRNKLPRNLPIQDDNSIPIRDDNDLCIRDGVGMDGSPSDGTYTVPSGGTTTATLMIPKDTVRIIGGKLIRTPAPGYHVYSKTEDVDKKNVTSATGAVIAHINKN